MSVWFDQFRIIFLSVYLEALPFLLFGCFVSALLHAFVRDEFLLKLIPKNRWVAMTVASLVGFVFPVCDCGIYPVARKLIQKKVPLYFVVTWMLSAPIVNPVVILSTWYAFYNQPVCVVFRIVGGFLVAFTTGIIFSRMGKIPVLKKNKEDQKKDLSSRAEACTCHSCGEYDKNRKLSGVEKWVNVFNQTGREFYDVGKYFIFGAICTAVIQTFFPKMFLISVGSHPVASVLSLAVLAFLLSLCSEADAFIARTFLGQFSYGSVIAFMLFGPVMDLKNFLFLSASFRKRFVWLLFAVTFILCIAIGVLINGFWIV